MLVLDVYSLRLCSCFLVRILKPGVNKMHSVTLTLCMFVLVGWLLVSIQVCFAMSLWWKIYFPFINAFMCGPPLLRRSWLMLDLMLFVAAVCRQSRAEYCGTSGFIARRLWQQKEKSDTSCFSPQLGFVSLVVVGNLPCTVRQWGCRGYKSVIIRFLWRSCSYVQMMCSHQTWRDPEQLPTCIALQPILEVDALLYLAGY